MVKKRSRKGTLSPLSSMTGFGRGVAVTPQGRIEVELRAVNSRFLDLVLKLPRVCNEFEAEIRQRLQAKLARGKVECYVLRTISLSTKPAVTFQPLVLDAYLTQFDQLVGKLGDNSSTARSHLIAELLLRREVMEVQTELPLIKEEQSALFEALEGAIDQLQLMRGAEGRALRAEIESRLERVTLEISRLRPFAQRTPQSLQEKLEARLKKLLAERLLDPARLAQEVAILADKLDVTEELVRLESHLAQSYALLQQPTCGKQFEFILQELSREANTLGSKAQDAKVQSGVIVIKAELEKLREQVLNLE